jgi:hypothetical protein
MKTFEEALAMLLRWEHQDLWFRVARRIRQVQETTWIKAHLTLEQALARGMMREHWAGNNEVDRLAKLGAQAHVEQTDRLAIVQRERERLGSHVSFAAQCS